MVRLGADVRMVWSQREVFSDHFSEPDGPLTENLDGSCLKTRQCVQRYGAGCILNLPVKRLSARQEGESIRVYGYDVRQTLFRSHLTQRRRHDQHLSYAFSIHRI